MAPDSDAAQRAFGGVVGDAQATVAEEASKRGPALETVVDRLGGLTLGGEPRAFTAQPSLQFDDERPTVLVAHTDALLWRGTVDPALDGEQRVDAVDGLGRDWRLLQPHQIKELAARMRPAGRLDDWSSLAAGFVEPVEAGIGIRLHQTRIARQVTFGMLATTVAGV